MIRRPPRSPLFPSTPLFRSEGGGHLRLAGPAPHLNCDPAPPPVRDGIRARLSWVDTEAARQLKDFAVQRLVPEHVTEVQQRQERLVKKTMAAVQDRLTKEIAFWDRRAAGGTAAGARRQAPE